MQDKIYHSGRRLQTLRELQGISVKELAKELNYEFDSITHWEKEGVPDEYLSDILKYFEVFESMFSSIIYSDAMLYKLALKELNRPALERDLDERLENGSKENLTNLDLSSLGLLVIPETVFDFSGLTRIDLSDNLLSEIPYKLQNLIDSGCEVIIRNNFIDPNLPNTYNVMSRNDDKHLVQKDLFIDKIRLVQLRLENIGIYKDIIINFNDELTVLIGINGAGKTTILKALSLAILGARSSIGSEATRLRSIDIPSAIDSCITLKASVSGVEYINKIKLQHDSDTGEINISGTPFEALYDTPNTMKNLILCLGEQRNNSSISTKTNLDKAPRILDLLPLLRGSDQSCIKDFTAWWANLENSKITNPTDQATINICFEIFSKFMGETVQSAGLKKIEPNTELWIKYETGKSVPFNLASQGYLTVMGWVGFIIQRMIEANECYPLPLSQPSIVIIDEIDQLLSVKWQQKILSILREFFPNTQWIISTHSPMVLTELDKHQVVQLHEFDGNIVAKTNEVDLWMWQYGDIIRRYFEVSTTPPKFQEEKIVEQIDSISSLEASAENNSQLKKLEDRLIKVRASRAAVDEFEAQLQSLNEREQQLIAPSVRIVAMLT
ncbi:MAG: AAA family ATPase [Moritella sp.]|uniref:AAA family ATPase n=1 Tax=Moritella sp. TaxID=78556 RepID=UPI001E0F85AB|nr:AAA family ATPase [Moritella sp.]NQZ42667.1 AAA family ATPase [Moritella sp.]